MAENPSSWDTGHGWKCSYFLACLTLHIRGQPGATEGAKLFADNLLLGQSFIHSRAASLQESIESQPSTQEFEKKKKGKKKHWYIT